MIPLQKNTPIQSMDSNLTEPTTPAGRGEQVVNRRIQPHRNSSTCAIVDLSVRQLDRREDSEASTSSTCSSRQDLKALAVDDNRDDPADSKHRRRQRRKGATQTQGKDELSPGVKSKKTNKSQRRKAKLRSSRRHRQAGGLAEEIRGLADAMSKILGSSKSR